MKKIAKMAVGLTAVTMAASAFAGGPEMAAPSINGFNIGLGFGYDSYSYSQVVSEIGGVNFQAVSQVNNNKFGPLGEIGYTFQVSNWAFLGIRAYWKYDDFRTQVRQIVNLVANNITNLQSHVAAMIVFGAMLNGSNAAYLEAGYTAIWGKSTLGQVTAPGGNIPVSATYTLSGGIAGIGWRHYFMSNVYLDLSYDFALYSDNSTTLSLPATTGSNSVNVDGVKRLHISGVTATLNYLFKV